MSSAMSHLFHKYHVVVYYRDAVLPQTAHLAPSTALTVNSDQCL